MDDYGDARWSNRGPIEVKVAIKLGPGRELRVEAGATEQIQGEDSLGDEAIPQVEGKELVHTAETSNEVIFERADGAFGGVSTVDAGRRKLEVDVFRMEKLLQGLSAFIVKALEAGP